MPISTLLTTLAILAAAPNTKPPAGNCRLEIQGRRIEKLTLQEEGGSTFEFPRPKEVVALPPGRYRVVRVDVQGGYSHVDRSRNTDADWLTIAPDKPCPLQIGAPLRPAVGARPGAMQLNLSCHLVDGAGRCYSGPRTNPPPTFTVYKEGKAIGSGRFEYG